MLERLGELFRRPRKPKIDAPKPTTIVVGEGAGKAIIDVGSSAVAEAITKAMTTGEEVYVPDAKQS